MSNENTAAVAEPTTAPKAAKVSKPKAAKKSAAKPESNKKLRPEVLKPQLAILRALAKAKGPMNKSKIVKASGVHTNWVIEFIGSADPVRDEVRGVKKLIPAGFVKAIELDIDGLKERCYEITSRGRKIVERNS